METNLEDYYEQLKQLHQKSNIEIEKNFNELKKYVSNLDPIKLLSQFTLTFLFVPEGKFLRDNDEHRKWARWIEFLAGYLVTQPYPKNSRKNIDGKHLGEIEKLLDKYFRSIETNFITSASLEDKTNLDVKIIVASTKIHSLYVRGDTYPQKFIELAEDLYGEHNNWLKENLGFTIKEAIQLFKSITDAYNSKTNRAKIDDKKEAKKYAEELIKNGNSLGNDRKQIEAIVSCYLYFGNSDKLLSFTLEDLSNYSNLSKETCQKFLNRLSQSFGYKNPKFKDTFQNPFSAPWDYNTLYERPIINYEDKYFVPLGSLFPTVLFYTFHYDLISDSNYKEHYNSKRGKWLEKRTASALRKIFPQDMVLLNPQRPDGTELADVIVLYDRKIFIIQCKSKRLTYSAKIGKDFQKLKDDIKEGIKDAFEQAIKAREYLNKTPLPRILTSDRRLKIDMKQVTDIFLVSITLGHYQNLATRLANTNPALNLFKNKEYPWAISIFDLEMITELIDYPSQFIHYAKKRIEIEQTNFNLSADEMDLLGLYFSQGLCFDANIFKKPSEVCINGFSEDAGIDYYIFKKYECGKESKKPKQKIPKGFEEYITEIEKLDSEYKTDCIMRLLDLNYQTKELFVNIIEQAKEKTRSNGKLYIASILGKNHCSGLSFISMNAGGNIEKLFRQTADFAIIKKYTTKCKEWVGLGWDINSKKKVDVVIFVSYDWVNDPVLDKVAKEILKKSEMINFKNK